MSASLWTQTRFSEEKKILKAINTTSGLLTTRCHSNITAIVMRTHAKMIVWTNDHDTNLWTPTNLTIQRHVLKWLPLYSSQTLPGEPHCCHDYVWLPCSSSSWSRWPSNQTNSFTCDSGWNHLLLITLTTTSRHYNLDSLFQQPKNFLQTQ